MQIQLARPLPFDLEGTDLSEYKHLAPAWHDWSAVCDPAAATAVRLLAGEGK